MTVKRCDSYRTAYDTTHAAHNAEHWCLICIVPCSVCTSVYIRFQHGVGSFVNERHYKTTASMAQIKRMQKCVMFTICSCFCIQNIYLLNLFAIDLKRKKPVNINIHVTHMYATTTNMIPERNKQHI